MDENEDKPIDAKMSSDELPCFFGAGGGFVFRFCGF
jgi:hypothetical protein